MLPFAVDRDSGVPVYRQLADYLKKQITSGVFQPGDILPSESDLMRDYEVSRTTARLAFAQITNAGLVRREQGKGSIVVSQVRSHLPMLTSFTEEVKRLGRTPGTVLLRQGVEKLTPTAARALDLSPDLSVTKAVRLRLADGEPIGLATTWLNDVKYPILRSLNYSALSLYQVYEEQLGLTIHNATEYASSDLVTEAEAQDLKIKMGSPVFRLNRTTYVVSDQEGGTPIEYVDGTFIGSVYTVEIELYRHGRT